MPRLVRKTDLLSDEAHRIMVCGLEKGTTAKAISEQVKKATGEKIAARSVGRFGTDWRAQREWRRRLRVRLHLIAEEGKRQGQDPSELLIAVACEHLEMNPNCFEDADPLPVQRLGLQAESLQLKHRQVEMQEKRLGLEQRKVELVEERERVIAAMKDKQKGEELSPEERITRVREIYGLTDGTAE
jgi:hypothetical protein